MRPETNILERQNREAPKAAAPRPSAKERFPSLAPASTDALAHKTEAQMRHVTSSNICEESTDFRERSEARDPCAVLTVYAINAMVMIFAFPLGFALLVFNILGGENLRTTSHVMGLTGLATALPLMGMSVPFLT